MDVRSNKNCLKIWAQRLVISGSKLTRKQVTALYPGAGTRGNSQQHPSLTTLIMGWFQQQVMQTTENCEESLTNQMVVLLFRHEEMGKKES